MSGRINTARVAYINLINRWLLARRLISEHEAMQAIQELRNTNNREEMKRIYDRYSDKARTVASTQGLTIEQFEEDRNRDFEEERDQNEDVTNINAYIRAKLSEKIALKKQKKI